ncbi:hypothetical protein D3C87_1097070 [compost metagenome]
MLGIGGGVGGQRDRAFRRPRHGAVVPVLSRHIEKCRNDYIGPLLAVGPHQPLDNALLPPAVKGLVAILGKTEVVNNIRRAMAEPADISIDDARSLLQLPRPDDAKRAQPFRPQRILPALTACGAGDDDPHAQLHAEIGKQPVLLVIRMRAGMHDGHGGFQCAQLAMQANEPRIGHLPFDALPGVKHGRSPPIFSRVPALRLPGMSRVSA